MTNKPNVFFCEEINARVTSATCESRTKHAKTVRESQLTPLYRICKFCNNETAKG